MKREAPRTQLYHALEEMSEVLDGDLDESEYERMAMWLRSARRSDSENLARLASTLEAYMGDARTGVYPVKPTAWSGLIARIEAAVGRVPRRAHRAAVLLILAALAFFAAAGAGLLVWTAAQPGPFRESFVAVLRAQGDLEALTNVGWRLLRIGLEAAVGAIALVAFVYLALRREQLGARLGAFALVLSLTTVNLLNFYIDQFTAVATALLQFAALLVVVSYRERGPVE
jgi:hypothetical protein